MADWNLPQSLATLYEDVLTYLKARDVDSATLFSTLPTNPVAGMFRWDRPTNTFQEYIGSTWTTKVIAISSGGTGANTPSGAVTNLGLGSMALQNANNVLITGGTAFFSALTSGTLVVNNAANIGANLRVVGQIVTGSSGITITDAAGKLTSILNTHLADLNGGHLTNIQTAALSGKIGLGNLGLNAGNINTVLRGDNNWASILDAQIDAGAAISWSKISKVGSSLAHLATRSAGDLDSGTLPLGRLGTNAPTATFFLRGDNTWAKVAMVKAVRHESIAAASLAGQETVINLPIPLTDWSKASIVGSSSWYIADGSNETTGNIRLISNTQFIFRRDGTTWPTVQATFAFDIVEWDY